MAIKFCSFGEARMHIKFRIIIASWKGGRGKILRTGKQGTSSLVARFGLFIFIRVVCFCL